MALRSLRSGATAMTEASFLQFITDLLSVSGIFDVLGGQFKVTNGTGLSVNIAVGRAYLLASSGNGYPVINDATISNQSINSNGSGNPRITSVVLYQDLAASPNSDASNVAKIMMVDGTPAGSPTAPSLSSIQSAVGAGNPFTILDDVRVNSGATAPTSHDYSRVQQVGFRSEIFNQEQWVTPTVNVGGTTTLDLSKGKKFQINMGAGNTTLALLNVPLNCKTIQVRITQDGSGGRTVVWFTSGSWANGVTPTLTTTGGKSDDFGIQFLSVTNDSTNTWEGTIINQNV